MWSKEYENLETNHNNSTVKDHWTATNCDEQWTQSMDGQDRVDPDRVSNLSW